MTRRSTVWIVTRARPGPHGRGQGRPSLRLRSRLDTHSSSAGTTAAVRAGPPRLSASSIAAAAGRDAPILRRRSPCPQQPRPGRPAGRGAQHACGSALRAGPLPLRTASPHRAGPRHTFFSPPSGSRRRVRPVAPGACVHPPAQLVHTFWLRCPGPSHLFFPPSPPSSPGRGQLGARPVCARSRHGAAGSCTCAFLPLSSADLAVANSPPSARRLLP